MAALELQVTAAATVGITAVTIKKDTTLTLSANPTGGTAPYKIQWTVNTTVKNQDQLNWKFTGIGSHPVKCVVTDATGATSEQSLSVIVE